MTHYLDYAATTPVRPEALEAMLPILSDNFGNPSGAHRMARAANQVLDEAREQLADALGCEPGEIVFTAGGTEADNLAITGTVSSLGGRPACSAIEHHAVLDPVEYHDGIVLPVTTAGAVDLDALAAVVAEHGESLSIVSVMLANNETGVVQPLAEIASMVRAAAPQALIHTDAVQALCWLDVAELAAVADLVSISGHKFGAPKGVGALVVREGHPATAKLTPILKGGGQERGRRGGTHNVAGIAALAVAAELTVAERADQVDRVRRLRDRLADGIVDAVPGAIETGDRAAKTANICHVCFEGIESEALLFLLEKADIMASAASSCASGAMEPSHVLAAMGFDRALAFGSLRLSLGYASTDADVDAVLAALPPAVERLRERG
ncbi:MAG: cysteine desulfurase [Acidimicrobiia bacterium]|nr:cysteine desulfurase [Acidimicrobiia bacterium]